MWRYGRIYHRNVVAERFAFARTEPGRQVKLARRNRWPCKFSVKSLGMVCIDTAAIANWGDVFLAVSIISIFQDGNSQTVAFETDELIDDEHWRFNISLATKTPEGEHVDLDMDDASPTNIKAL